ncbi:MAG: DUF1549 domain-containing protein [Planctomycetaceae bacterium]|jgi:hypothetical protein|nr:DUF1549 domain-containing protein [Planctomycetaceae bacterium]
MPAFKFPPILAATICCLLPLIPTAISAQESATQVRNIIDAEILATQDLAVGDPVGISDDYTFARRISMDLTGRPLTVTALQAFIDDVNPDKRERLIDSLLASPQYARHMQYKFDVLLMQRLPKKYIAPSEFSEFLRQSFGNNKPYDQLVLEILTADGADKSNRAASRFLLDRELKREETVRVIGQVFLGRDLQCAQCHNHPQIDDYFQQHYYGLAAFLKRSYLFTDPKSKVVSIGDKIEGDVTFTSVFTGEEGKTQPRMLALTELPDPPAEKEPYKTKPDKTNRGVPKYNRRLQLGPNMISDENAAFRLNITNRIWAQMMGQGFVEPLDLFHEANVASHPALLQVLADALRDHKYDLKYLFKEIAMSQSYQRSSYWNGDTIPSPNKYYNAAIKPLSAEQFAWTLLQSLGEVQKQTKAAKAALLSKNKEFDAATVAGQMLVETKVTAALKGPLDTIVAVFASQNTSLKFTASANHALYLINGPEITQRLTPGGGYLIDELLAFDDDAAMVEYMYLHIYSRKPVPAEREQAEKFVADAGDAKQLAVQELMRTLLCSAEYRFVR